MNAKVIVVTSGKGGVGKTTTTANIGAGLAKLGEKVVVIDVDVGLRNLDVVMGLESRVVFDLVDVLEGKCRLSQAVIRDKRVETLYLLPASQTRDKDALDPEVFKGVVRQLIEEEGFTRVLIDSPAGIESGFRTAAAPAEGALVVVNPEVSSVRDADRIIGLLEAQQVGEIRLVINRLRPKMVASGNMLSEADVLEILGVKPIGIVPEDDGILVSTNVGEPAVLGKSVAGQAFMDTARRIKGEDVPYPKLEQDRGFLAIWRRLFGGVDMFSWLNKRRSKETLKDRLELVLAYDRAQIPPGKVDALRHDLLEVVKRYFPAGNSSVDIEQHGDKVVLSASISLEEPPEGTGRRGG